MTDTDGEVEDLHVIGTGPAGLTAAIYAGRYGFETTLFEKESIGGELVNRDRIRGYPGFPDGIPGTDLRTELITELKRYDPRVLLTEVEAIEPGSPHTVRTESGEHRAEAIIIATGGRPKPLGVPGEDKYLGRGVFDCAKCDGPLYRDEVVAVAGGTDHALVDALSLAEFASEVIVLSPDSMPTADTHLNDELASTDNLTVETDTEIASIHGQEGVLDSITLRDTRGGSEQVTHVEGLYIHAGIKPNTEFVESVIPLDDNGQVEVNETMETPVDDVFAVGDVRQSSPGEVAAAVGDAVVAIDAIRETLSSR